jgi:hypothetical protein
LTSLQDYHVYPVSIKLFEKVIFQLQVPGHFALGYLNGNAVKIRGGRAAVSVCSDSYIGNPRGIFIHCPAEKSAGWEGALR